MSELTLQALAGEYTIRESDGLMSINETTGPFEIEVEMELGEDDDDVDDAVVDCGVVELVDCVLVVLEVELEALDSAREEEDDEAELVEGAASLASY